MPRLYHGWIVVVVSTIVLFVNASVVFSFGVFFKPMLEDLDCGRAVLSGCYSLALVLGAFCGILGGKLSDKFGLRVMLTSNGILLGIGYLLMSRASSVQQIYLFYILVSLGLSCSLVPIISTIPRWFVEKRGLATGIAVAGVGLGGLATPLLSQWLISLYGWDQSYAILGLASLVIIIPLAQLIKHKPPEVTVAAYTKSTGVKNRQPLDSTSRGFSYTEAIKTRQFWIFFLMMFCFFFSLQTVIVHIVPYATDMGIPETIAAGILATISGMSIAGRVGIGFLSDKIGNRLSMCSCLTVATLGLVGFVFAREVLVFYAIVFFFGMAYGGILPLVSTTAAQLFDIRSLGVINGSITFGGILGGSLGAFLGGLIFDMTGNYMPILLIAVVLCALSICLSLILFTRGNDVATTRA